MGRLRLGLPTVVRRSCVEWSASARCGEATVDNLLRLKANLRSWLACHPKPKRLNCNITTEVQETTVGILRFAKDGGSGGN